MSCTWPSPHAGIAQALPLPAESPAAAAAARWRTRWQTGAPREPPGDGSDRQGCQEHPGGEAAGHPVPVRVRHPVHSHRERDGGRGGRGDDGRGHGERSAGIRLRRGRRG